MVASAANEKILKDCQVLGRPILKNYVIISLFGNFEG